VSSTLTALIQPFIKTNRQSEAELIASTESPALTVKLNLVSKASSKEAKLQAIVVFVTEENKAEWKGKTEISLATSFDRILPDPVALPEAIIADFDTEKGVQFVYPAYRSGSSIVPRVLLVGIGKESKVDVLRVRKAVHSAISVLRDRKFLNVGLVLPDALARMMKGEISASTHNRFDQLVDTVARTVVLSNHTFDKWLDKTKLTPPLESVTLLCASPSSSANATMARAQMISECTVMARELANDRADQINPKTLEALAKTISNTHKLKMTVLSESTYGHLDIIYCRPLVKALRFRPD